MGEFVERQMGLMLGKPVSAAALQGAQLWKQGVNLVARVLLITPLVLPLAMLMMIPAMFFLTYRTIVEWREARRLCISPGRMVFVVLMAWGIIPFGSLAVGLMFAMYTVLKGLLPWMPVVLAKTDQSYVLLYKSFLSVHVPKFTHFEEFALASSRLELVSREGRRVVLRLKSDKQERDIRILLDNRSYKERPDVFEANLGALLAGQ